MDNLPEADAPTEKEPLRGILAESKEMNRGVTVYPHCASVSLVVTELDDRYVIGGVSAAF